MVVTPSPSKATDETASDTSYEVTAGRGLAVSASDVVSEGTALHRGDSGLNLRGGKGRRDGGGPAPGPREPTLRLDRRPLAPGLGKARSAHVGAIRRVDHEFLAPLQ